MKVLERVDRVLIVDDSLVTARIVAGFLKQNGVPDVDVVFSGQEALDEIGKHAYSLIVSDFVMYPMTGMQLWRRLQSRSDTCHIPFLLMTTPANNAALSPSDRAQLGTFLIKPFTAGALMACIAEVMERKKVA
jgi:two-component system chemotaxis response regulator CheY